MILLASSTLSLFAYLGLVSVSKHLKLVELVWAGVVCLGFGWMHLSGPGLVDIVRFAMGGSRSCSVWFDSIRFDWFWTVRVWSELVWLQAVGFLWLGLVAGSSLFGEWLSYVRSGLA